MTPTLHSTVRQKAAALLYLLAFIACIPIANWMIGHVGTVCVPPHGPCLVPVWPWGPKDLPLMAPSGVLMIGLALTTTAVWSVVDAAWFAARESEEYKRWVRGFAFRLALVGAIWAALAGAWYVFGTWWSGEVSRSPRR